MMSDEKAMKVLRGIRLFLVFLDLVIVGAEIAPGDRSWAFRGYYLALTAFALHAAAAMDPATLLALAVSAALVGAVYRYACLRAGVVGEGPRGRGRPVAVCLALLRSVQVPATQGSYPTGVLKDRAVPADAGSNRVREEVMRTLKIVLLICVIVGAGACGERREEPPAASQPEPATVEAPASPEASASSVLAEMLAVAEAGDWGAYVDRFYGEKDKFTSPADQAVVVARFAEKWGAKVTEALKATSGVTPRIEDGKAIFEVDGQVVFVLHEGPGGSWTFHL